MLTGEGRFDRQSAAGKASHQLLLLAKKYGKKTILISGGSKEEGIQAGFDQVISLPDLESDQLDREDEAAYNLKMALREFFDLGT